MLWKKSKVMFFFKDNKNHYPEVLRYICKDVLDNDFLYNNLKKVNSHANNVKHSLEDIKINIKDVLIYYNAMIDKLSDISGCKSFKICHIWHKPPKSRKKEILCNCCKRRFPEITYRCPQCKKIICDMCYNREIKMCVDCAKGK